MKCVLGGGEVFAHVARLFGEEALGAVEGYTPVYCFGVFTEVYLLKEPLLGAVELVMRSGRVPYFAGLYAGRLRSSRPAFIPSHILVEKIYRHLGRLVRAVRGSEAGIKAVLYGRDLLAESATSCYEPVELGDVLSVVGPDGRVYAVGLSRISSCEELGRLGRTDTVVKTVFDLGWYLRGGTVPREVKYRL